MGNWLQTMVELWGVSGDKAPASFGDKLRSIVRVEMIFGKLPDMHAVGSSPGIHLATEKYRGLFPSNVSKSGKRGAASGTSGQCLRHAVHRMICKVFDDIVMHELHQTTFWIALPVGAEFRLAQCAKYFEQADLDHVPR